MKLPAEVIDRITLNRLIAAIISPDSTRRTVFADLSDDAFTRLALVVVEELRQRARCWVDWNWNTPDESAWTEGVARLQKDLADCWAGIAGQFVADLIGLPGMVANRDLLGTHEFATAKRSADILLGRLAQLLDETSIQEVTHE